MVRAIWNGTVLAESDRTEIVEGNHYFAPGSVRWEHFQESDTHTVCPWKGTASYYHIVAGNESNRDAAWCYPSAKEGARHIEGYVAFWRGVTIEP